MIYFTCIIIKCALDCECVHEACVLHVPVPLFELLVVIDMMQADGKTTETNEQKHHYHTCTVHTQMLL